LKEDMALLQRNYRSAKEGLQVAKDQLALAVQRAGELEKWQAAHLHNKSAMSPRSHSRQADDSVLIHPRLLQNKSPGSKPKLAIWQLRSDI
jgi:hypothetical protein